MTNRLGLVLPTPEHPCPSHRLRTPAATGSAGRRRQPWHRQAGSSSPFTYATYDRRDDTIVIAVGGKTPKYPVLLRHMINKPATLSIDHSSENPAVLVTDADGTSTLVQFFGQPDPT